MQDLILLTLTALVGGALLQVGVGLGVPVYAAAALAVMIVAGLGIMVMRGRRRAGDTATPVVTETRAKWILGGILVVSLALRLFTLMDRPAWDDEMWTLRNIYTSSWGELLRVAFDDYWPPLHYLLLNALARVTSTELIWLRLPSVLFGVAGVAAMYWLAMLLFRNRLVALAAAALLGGMTTHVLFSQEARVYSLLVLLVILSAGFFYRSYWARRISPAFILATCLVTYSHSFASWYFIAAECTYVVLAWLIWRDRKAAIRGFYSQVIVLLLWVPLIVAFVHARFSRDIIIPTYWATGEESPPGLIATVELYQGLAVRSWTGAAFMALLFALTAGLAWRLWRQGRRAPAAGAAMDDVGAAAAADVNYPRAIVFLLCWVSIPILFSLVVTLATPMKTFSEIRYHLAALPGLCLLAAAGFGALRTRAQAGMAAALLVLLPVSQLPRYYFEFEREAFDEAAAIVHAHATPGEDIYVGNGYRVFGYYYRGIFPRIGSQQWDSLTAAHADQTDRWTLESPKWGDTYAYEKLPANIKYYWSIRYDTTFDRFIDMDVARGGFRDSFWLIMPYYNVPVLLDALDRHGISCRASLTRELEGIEIRHCNAPD